MGRKYKELRLEIHGGWAGNTRRIAVNRRRIGSKYKEDRQEIQGG